MLRSTTSPYLRAALGLLLLVGLLCGVALATPDASPDAPRDMAALVTDSCTKCHDTGRVCAALAAEHDGAWWVETVGRMTRYGAQLEGVHEAVLAAFLVDRGLLALEDCATAAMHMDDFRDTMGGPVMKVLALFHPALMTATLFLALAVLRLGIVRGRAVFLKEKVKFEWKKHVLWGYLTMGLWLAGFVGGYATARLLWGQSGITGHHFDSARLMLPFIVFGLASGAYMDRKKAPRKLLPLLHGANNLALVGCNVYQLITGLPVLVTLLSA